MLKKSALSLSLIAVIAIFVPHKFWHIPQGSPQVSSASIQVPSPEPPAIVMPAAPVLDSTLTTPDFQAKSILAQDLQSGTDLYSMNSKARLPIASLTKLMTAMVVLDHVNKDAVVTVTPADINVSPSNMGLVSGEKITVENLLKGLLIPSGNDAAQTLARFVGGTQDQFVSMMNEKAMALGLLNTHYSNPVGLDAPDNYSTALDLSVIAKEFLKYDLLSKIVDTKAEDVTSTDGSIVHHLHTSNKLLLSNPEVVGVKTGETTEAQGNLIVKVVHDTHPVLTIVLNTPDREGDSQKLIDWIFKAYNW